MDLNEFLEKLRGDDLLKKDIKVEKLNVEDNPGGVAKVTIYAEREAENGALERLWYAENTVLSCGHVAKAPAAVCECKAFTFCQACASSGDNLCLVCSKLMCPVCRAKSFLHNKARCHKKCRWKFILNSLFER